jgi:hypothetical protein
MKRLFSATQRLGGEDSDLLQAGWGGTTCGGNGKKIPEKAGSRIIVCWSEAGQNPCKKSSLPLTTLNGRRIMH